MPAITVGPHYGQSPIVIMPSADGFVETFQPFWFQEIGRTKNGLGTPLGGQNGGQVQELLDILTWAASFEGFELRPTMASYS